MRKIPVFISSKQEELREERVAVAEVMSRLDTLEPVMAENWFPQRGNVHNLYLEEVLRCPIFLGLFWKAYSEPTHREYKAAIGNDQTEILLYLKSCPDQSRDARLLDLIGEFSGDVRAAKFTTVDDLKKAVPDHLLAAVVRMVTRLHHSTETTRSSNNRSEQLLYDWGLGEYRPGEVLELLRESQIELGCLLGAGAAGGPGD